MRSSLPGASFALVALLALSFGAHAQNTPLPLEGYLDLADVADAHISPDGKRVVYMLRTVDKINDRRQSAMWLVNADGTGAQSLGKGAGVGWAPDSRRIAYIAPGDGSTRAIFVRDLDSGGAPLQVVRAASWPGNLAWSADGRTLAFTMLVPRVTKEWQLDLPGRPAQAQWAAEPRIIERLVFRRDGVGFLDDGRMHIFTVPATGGAPPRQLTQGDRDYGGGPDFVGTLSWTPDNREIVFSTFDPQQWEYPWRDSDVHAIDATTGAMRRLTTRKGPDFNPVVSPDGRWVAYGGYDWSDDSYIPTQLYVAGIDGSNPHSITATLDRSICTSASPIGAPRISTSLRVAGRSSRSRAAVTRSRSPTSMSAAQRADDAHDRGAGPEYADGAGGGFLPRAQAARRAYGARAHGRRVSRAVRRAAVKLPAPPVVSAALVRSLQGLRRRGLRARHEPAKKRRGFSTVTQPADVTCSRIAARIELNRTGFSKRGASR